MNRDEFLKSLNTSCAGLRRHFRDASGLWLVKILSGKGDIPTTESKLDTDRVYELLCCFAILKALQGRVSNLRMIPGGGRQGYRFPYGPGSKENFAFFRFELDGETYDLCFGTGIPCEGGTNEHPDISLQVKLSSSTDSDRTPGQPVALWDGKYHRGNAGKADVQQMNWWCSIFELSAYSGTDVLKRLLDEPLNVSSVITNAAQGHTNRPQMLRQKFSMVLGFTGDPSICTATPSRSEHESAH